MTQWFHKLDLALLPEAALDIVHSHGLFLFAHLVFALVYVSESHFHQTAGGNTALHS